MKRLLFKAIIFLYRKDLRYEESRKWQQEVTEFGWERKGYWYKEIYIYKNGTDPFKHGFIDIQKKRSGRWRIIRDFFRLQKDPKFKLR